MRCSLRWWHRVRKTDCGTCAMLRCHCRRLLLVSSIPSTRIASPIGIEEAHDEVGKRALAASRLADQCDRRPDRHFEADPLECRLVSVRIGEGWFRTSIFWRRDNGVTSTAIGLLIIYGQSKQVHRVPDDGQVACGGRPASVDLLDQGQQALRAEGHCAEHGKRCGKAAGALRDQHRDHCDRDHAGRFDQESRRHGDGGGA